MASTLRSIKRFNGEWDPGDLSPAHAERLRRAAGRCPGGCPDKAVAYLERMDRNQVALVDAEAYGAAKTDEEKHKAILYAGPAPSPEDEEVAAALLTLSHAGFNPLNPRHMRRAYLQHVVLPVMEDAADEDAAFYRRALAHHRDRLSSMQRELYRTRLQQKGKG